MRKRKQRASAFVWGALIRYNSPRSPVAGAESSMDLNWFMLLSCLALPAPIGLAVWRCAFTGESFAKVFVPLIFTLAAAAGLFATVGPAIIHSSPDSLAGIDFSYLLLRQFDNTALHHTLVMTLGAAVIGAATNANLAVIAPLVVVFFPLLAAVAIKTAWFGLLRNGGVIAIGQAGLQLPGAMDVAGAMAIFLPAGAMALVAQSMLGESAPSPHPLRERRGMMIAASALLLIGFIAHVMASSVMQSPATVMNAAMNALRGAAAGAVVGAILARTRQLQRPAGEVAASMLAGLVAITAAAGRAPGIVALATGSAAAVSLPFVSTALRSLGLTDPTRLISICFGGGVVGVLMAAPFAVTPEPLPLQIFVQLAGGAFFTLLAVCLGALYCIFARAVRGARPRVDRSGVTSFSR